VEEEFRANRGGTRTRDRKKVVPSKKKTLSRPEVTAVPMSPGRKRANAAGKKVKRPGRIWGQERSGVEKAML